MGFRCGVHCGWGMLYWGEFGVLKEGFEVVE